LQKLAAKKLRTDRGYLAICGRANSLLASFGRRLIRSR